MGTNHREFRAYSKTNYFEGVPPISHNGRGWLLESHKLWLGYTLWLLGFFGIHRFYFGRPFSGAIWLFTLGLFGIGWLIDIFLIPDLKRAAEREYQSGPLDYSVAWILFLFFGVLGVHRFYQGKLFTGLAFFFTGCFVGLGLIYDLLTLNEQLSELNLRRLKNSRLGVMSY